MASPDWSLLASAQLVALPSTPRAKSQDLPKRELPSEQMPMRVKTKQELESELADLQNRFNEKMQEYQKEIENHPC